MIFKLYAGYVDRMAADRGALAFFKWFMVGVVLQVAFIVPAAPLLALAMLTESDVAKIAALLVFLAAFAALRIFLFAWPCAEVSGRKGYHRPWAWFAGGLVFGQFATGLIGALPAKAPPSDP